jgi:diguanylate cyclase (GGDEF)-like protein/hemerythrin-like metal-binding protein
MRRDGREVVVSAQALVVANGVLLVFEEVGSPVLVRENERLHERITELESATVTDPLTGAWNRPQFERIVDLEMRRAVRSGQPVALILIDIDHFKRINDTFGHLAGDAVLKEFVGRIRRRMRDPDALFRWGGEEFFVLATAVGYRGGAVLAEGLRRAIASTPFPNVGRITASLGVSEYVEGETAESWLQRTDLALYAAKRAGRDRIHVDRQESPDRNTHRLGSGVPSLYWLEAYECGDPTIDAEHRELFEMGNALIAAAGDPQSAPALWHDRLHAMLAHLVRHFGDEEAVLHRAGYPYLSEHRRVHAALLRQANDLVAAVEGGQATPSRLLNFLVNDIIALHLLRCDRDFHAQLQGEDAAGAVRATASSAESIGRLH